MLKSEFVSRVINTAKGLTKDDHLSRRYILSIGMSKAAFYIAQKLRDRSLHRESNLYTELNCFPLKEENIVKCGVVEFKRCNKLMKSVHKLPSVVTSRYGEAILSVLSIDDGTKFNYANLSQISSQKNRMFGNVDKYFYIKDGYLYIPNESVRAVNLQILTLDPKKANDVSDCANEDCCKSIWEYPFICPDKLLEVVIQETVQEVAGINKRIPQDENPNLNNNEK